MPHSLAELLETRQALEVIPGVLYFASVGERLRSLAEPPAPANVSPRDEIEASAARAAMEASMRDAPRISHRRGRSDAAQSLLLRQMMLRDTDGDANFCGELENGVFYVSVGESPSFQYHSFFADFGPLGLNSVTCLSRCLEGLLRCCAAYSWSTDNDNTTSNNNVSGGVFGPRPGGGGGADSNKTGGGCADKTTSHGNIPIVFCSGMKNHERANAACLLACFCVATLRWTASVTWHIFQHAYPPLIPFRDAGCGVSTFPLGILDVISGLEKAVAFGWYDVRTFDLAEYERLRRCDCSWVVPHMFLALSSPNRSIPCRSPKVYTKLFQQLKVTLLMRLNEPLYRRETFLASGIQHVDLQFPDGTAPNDDIINRFLKTVEPIVLPQEQRIKKRQDKQTSPNHYHHHHHGIHRKQMKKNNLRQGDKTVEEKKHMGGGTIAMHCHAGLGRTGTLICVYLIRHCGFTARESIGWTRLCRPGSVIGVQQSFLERLEWRISPFAKKSHMMRGNLDPRMYGSRSISAGSNYTCEIRDMRQTMTSSSPTLPTTTTTAIAATAAAVTGCRPATAITMATTKNTAEQLLLLKKQQQQQRAVVYDTSCARRLSLTEIFKNPSSFFIALKKKTSSHHNYVGKLLRSVEQQQQQQQYTEGNHSLMTGQGGGSTTNTQTDVWMSSEEKAAPQFPVAHMSLQQSQPQPAMPSLAASHAANPAKQEDNESNTQERLVLLPGNDDHINRSQKSHQTQLIPSHPNPLSILCSATTSTAPWQAPTVTAEVQAIGQSSRLQKERRVITMMGNSNTSTSTNNNNNNGNNNVTIVKHVDMDLVNNVDPQFRLSGFTSSTNMSPNDENKSMTSAAARCLRASPSFGPPFRTTTRLAARKHLQREEMTLLTREEVEAVAAAATDPGWGGMAVRLAPWKKKKYI